MKSPPAVMNFFVDEAGDLTLFDRHRRLLVGQPGVSHSFMVGSVEIADPAPAAEQLESLRRDLLANPYFANIPSMQPDARKTAYAFHACKDVPEVRYEVIRLLATLDAKVFVCMRRKLRIAEDFRAAFERTGVKRGADSIYDDLVTRVFKERLHLAGENRIVFARRGKADRNVALSHAIQLAKREFEGRWAKGIDRPTTISSSVPSVTPCLQIVDYFLWAVQRLVERREDRFFSVLADKYRLIIDRDDDRRNGYGEYYNSKNPLSLEKVMPVL